MSTSNGVDEPIGAWSCSNAMWERAKQLLDGDPAYWPSSLRSAITFAVATPTPVLVWWGPGLTQLYNDAAIPELDALNAKYPALRSEVERVRTTGVLGRVGTIVLLPVFETDQTIAGVTGAVILDAPQTKTDDRELVVSVGHELRNPLSTLSTMLQVLMLREPSDDLQLMSRALQQVTRIIDNVVDSSWITHGRIVLQRQHIEVAAIIQRATELAATTIPVHLAVPSANSVVDGDLKRLARAIANLISNATTSAPRGARVIVSTQRRDDSVEIRISDDGGQREPGEAAILAQSRAEPALRLAHHNARGVIELHGGSVSLVDSPGSLPECVITLPLATAPTSERSMPTVTDSKRLLLVEDNDEGARALEAALVHRGYQVALAHNAPIALNLAKTFKPDVVLVDLGLPVMDGWELAKRLRSTATELPIIAVTARDQPSDFQRSAELGFAEHLVKPIDLVELERVVRRVSP